MKTMSLLLLLGLAGAGFSANALVVKTSHEDVNLWSDPGRVDSDQIDVVKQHEEVFVTGKAKVLPNGQKWYPVLLRRLPDWRKYEMRGWVDAKYFHTLDESDDADQPEAGTKATCPTCLNPSKPGFRLPVPPQRGQKISKLGFIWPAQGRLSSGFGLRRHPVLGHVKPHNGIDISGNANKPIVAAKAGRVIMSDRKCRVGDRHCHRGAGNMVQIDHGGGVVTEYFHLSGNCPLPKAGSFVKQGQQIACVGKTGVATGYHLHFGVKINGKYVDPIRVLPRR